MSAPLTADLESFRARPEDAQAFDALEERLFVAGQWPSLVDLYEARLRAASVAASPREKARLLTRIGRVLCDHLDDPARADGCFRGALAADPRCRPALAGLRRLAIARASWDVALQIAEVEAGLEMPPDERAALLCEVGELWLARLGDAELALGHFRSALEARPQHAGALAGHARALEALGRHAEAAAAFERAAAALRGSARAEALAAQARLLAGSLREPERASELCRRALTEDPRCADAAELLATLAAGSGQWSLLSDLLERRFALATDPAARAAIALEAGRVALERHANLATARLWLARAEELAPEHAAIHDAFADLERECGDDTALRRRLERLVALEAEPLVADLLELAALLVEAGDAESAVTHLKSALSRAPEDAVIVDELAEALAQLGRWAELADCLERRAALVGPDPVLRAGILVELGALHEERLGDPDAARAAYARALADDPSAPDLAARAARVCRKSEAWDELRRVLERAAASGPEPERAASWCELGELLEERFADPDGAVLAFDAALALDAASARAHRGRQALASARGDAEGVLAAFAREAAVTTDAARLRFLVAEVVRGFEAEGRLAAALPLVARQIALCPEDVEALRLGADLARRLGRETEELEALARLEARVAGAEQAAARLRRAEIHLAAGRADAAAEAARAAIAAAPGERAAHALLVDALERAGRVDEAVAARRGLVPLLPEAERGACLDALARLQAERTGDLAGAIESLLGLAAGDGAPADLEPRLEELYARSGRHEELAQRLARRAEALSPGSPEATALELRRARVLLEPMGRADAAAEAYEAVLALDPACAEARSGLERALRAAGDADRLAAFLAQQADAHPDPATRERYALERAALLDEILGRAGDALAVCRALWDGALDPATRSAAGARLERLLEREHAWPSLRAHLEARLAEPPGPDRVDLHERLGRLCRDRVSDPDAAIAHFEAAAALVPARPELWHSLARLYEESDRPADLARVLEAELATQPRPEREHAIRRRVAALAAGPLGAPERARAHYERLLERDPTDAVASEFLVSDAERGGRWDEVVRLLERRLARLDEEADPAEAPARIALRLRIAGLRATRLADAAGAIAMLEPALEASGPVAALAEPLADLYQASGQADALAALCQRAAQHASEGAERAGWLARLGDVLRERGADREAVAAYRQVLTEQPSDRRAQTVLRDLYRKLDEPAPLARLLEVELTHRAGPSEVPVRMELVQLLAQRLERPGDALLHLRRVLQVEPGCTLALEQALALARRESRGEILRELLDEALARPQPAATRAALLASRGRLRAGEPDRGRDAAADLRESLALDPSLSQVREELREQLERLGDWAGVLDLLRGEALGAEPGEREALLDEAAGIAWTRLSPDAALPWLERLRCDAPRRRDVVARIGEAHRLAGRADARLRALEDEAALAESPAERCALHVERARVLERELGSSARAVAALADARRCAPGGAEVLAELDRLFAALGRDRERAEVIEARLAHCRGEAHVALLREAARLWTGPLGDPERAAHFWARAVEATPAPGPRRAELLSSLGEALRASAPSEVWASCAEAELAALDADDPVFADRREALHRELFEVQRRAGRSDAALRHLRPIVAAAEAGSRAPEQQRTARGAAAPSLGPGPHSDAEPSRELGSALLDLLREAGAWLELEQRLAEHLARWPEAAGWLELARLRDERLRQPGTAAEAYKQALALDPASLAALRGLRAAAERTGDFATVADALEREVEHSADAPAAARAALLRTLGDVAWHRLGQTPRASRCYARALEADPEDFASLHALEELLEAMEDWQGAVRLYESEVEALGHRDPARQQAAWLRAGELARDHLGDPERARRAYAEAAVLGPVPPVRLAELAELHRRCGDLVGFAASFGHWCDDPGSQASATDHLHLAATLEGLGRRVEALARAGRASELDPSNVVAFDLAARLHRDGGDAAGAITALERAAALANDGEGAARLLHAALLATDAGHTAKLLHEAARRDPSSVPVQAELAGAEHARGAFDAAESAAARALELSAAAPSASGLDRPARLALALLGGRCARARRRAEAAARFFAQALRESPRDHEALSGSAESLAELGDLAGAREALELRLAADDAYPERALHHALLSRCVEAAGDAQGALKHAEAALRLDASQDEAHARCVRLHERAGRVDEGVAALERWAATAPDAESRAERLLRAAEWEMRETGREEAAEQHFRESVRVHPASARGWQGLAWLLWHRGSVDEALRVASEALAHGADDGARGPLSLLRGRALERQGARADAAEAYAVAASADPRCLEAALARARLLRAMGDWRGAADALHSFVERHPGDDPRGVAEALEQQGRLLAGPLEDVDGATLAYERAIRLDPESLELRAALASLLSHRPERWREALAQQQAILVRDPTHAPTLRAALRVAASRQRPHAVDDGLAILRALGLATASELAAAPVRLSAPIAGGGALEHPLHEKLRVLAEKAAREIGDALGAAGGAPDPSPGDPLAAFRAAAFAAEGRLWAPALLPLPTGEVGEILLLVAALALDAEPRHASGRLVNALSTTLGRRTRRGLRRLLEGVALEDLAAVDFGAWRSELRALAAAVALDETGADLRTSLVALAAETSEGAAELAPGADLSAHVAASPEARSLLLRAERSWLARV